MGDKSTMEIDIPDGLGQIITPSGQLKPAKKALVVKNGAGTGVKTAYPIE